MSAAITTDLREFGDTAALLTQMDVLLRGKALTDALKKAGKPVVARAKSLAPVGGARKGQKAGKKHLRDTITLAARDYGETKVLVVGPAYPAGAHGHLVEFGSVDRERKSGGSTGRMPPQPFLRPAVEATRSEQNAAFIGELQRHIEQVSR